MPYAYNNTENFCPGGCKWEEKETVTLNKGSVQ